MKRISAYPAHRYDEQAVLKIPLPLWLTILFLVRHVVLVLLSFLPRSGEAMSYLRDLVDPLFLLGDLPATLVLFAATRRKPDAPGWVRKLWHKGKPMLAASALLYLLLLSASLTISARPFFSMVNEALIVSVLMHLAILVYLSRSPLVRDVFSEFPSPSHH
jgi:hypothetical protein